MKLRQKSQKSRLISLITALLLLTFQGMLLAQTPGMIIEPATGTGSLVLDPNGDGYVSVSQNGFLSDDETESEIAYTSFIFPGLEPNSDLNNAPNCGFTDFVDKGNKDPGRKFLSTANNWLFRLRMGSVSPNAKSYSVLIDTDGLFGNTGANADPNYSLNNPGFEIEIVLATKFGVFVYDVNTPNCTPVISYPGTTNYQKAIALTTDCNDPDYFLDFFVNFNDLATQFGITTSTLMRYAILDNTAANKSTICNPSSASDIAGVGNCTNLSACLTTIVNYQGFCAPNQTLCLARTSCPSIIGTISNSATTVSGTSSESNGTIIRLYKNSIFTASTTVTGGAWSITGLTPLVVPNVIAVTAQAAGAYESLSDCNTQTISACGAPAVAPVIQTTSGKNFCGTGIVGYDIVVHRPDMTVFTASPATSAYLPVPSGGSWVWKCTGNTGGCNSGSGVDCINNGGYIVFQTDVNGCRSLPAFACVSQGGGYSPLTSITPTLIASSVISGATTVAVNVGLNTSSNAQSGYVYLFLNGAYYCVSSLVTASGTVAVTCPALPGCSTLTAMFIQSASGTNDHDCFSGVSNSVAVAGGVTAAPQISGSFCTAVNITSVTGISSEANGTTIQLLVNSVNAGSPVTVNNGTWTVTGLNIAPGSTLQATALAACKSVSALSPSVLVTSQTATTSLSVTTTPIFEQGTTVSGTGVNGSVVQLYIDGYPVGGTVTVSGGVWTVTNILSYELYTGGVVAVAATNGGGCPSALVPGGVVQCIAPSTTLGVSPANMAICTNTGIATLTITGTQSQVVYQLFLANGTTSTGRSILGNGGNMTISTGTLSSNTTLKVKAMKIPAAACNVFLTNTVGLVFGAPTTSLAVSVSPTTICSEKIATVTVANSQTGFNYQLRNNSNNAAVGGSVAGTGSAITFTTGALSANTVFNVLSSGTGINTCSSTLSALATISVNSSPTLTILNNTGTTTLTCNTPSVSLSANGGVTYSWSPSVGTAANVTVTAPGNYSITTAAANGCTASTVFAVTQTTAAPVLTLAATANSLCTGQSATLSVSGATSYTWMPGNATTTSIVVSPSTTTIYTVTGGDGICIGTATFSLLMSPCITVANDFTNTIQNTPVSGNVALNDGGTNGATFSITTQPAGGTVTINPSTGQFTFTPSPTFTGVTTATYNLCNGAPVTCSSAVISVTVYPSLIANLDQITTTPSVTATGTLVNNDGGVVAGPVYSISVTPLAPTSGTITVNPTTGGYTFVPNPSFTGTTSTTYTICNTSVNPTVCSSASILIQVGNTPVAVADFTTTMINTVVSGNAATNDGGVITALNPAFSISQPLSGTGTVSINASTGVYSYTPATGFTGTTSCTYTLCNTLSPPCSTAAITFTVYPAVVTNSDIVSTTPGVVRTGSLAVNDLGILVSGTLTANYQFAITQPAASVGTFVINPANGQYTFTPNPSYTGSTVTTYTACNTSVMPSVCSSTTVVIYVYPTPAPVNDFTNTVSGGTVVASASANDSGTTSAVYSLLNQPAGGTLTINPATGIYTFAAAPAFSGVTTATYNLCNGAATTCSTAVISITVHPLIVANPDLINTSPTSSVTGNLLGNDAGITSTLGATYSVTVVQPSSSTGTFVLNPSTGQYTFIPNPTFSGSVQTTYQVCNTAVNPQQCSTATITINVYPGPIPVNDFTTTVINTPVVGNVGTNDSGTSGGTFSITGQPTGGSVVINPSTGQFTFTPTPSFTGVTTATYNLCNGAPVTCSTAVLSVTVHPLIVANPDLINTSPTSSVTGNLLGNDAGITSTLGATYSVTVVQPASSTGTIVLNPSTGQYTFIPNPTFSGSVQTTYQVCNTAVNPQQCSTATITINVYPGPIPVNDFTTTVINTPVVGNVGTNDSGTSGGTFSITGQPTGGSVAINPSTGQYTFTPAPGFTGVTTATYNLCNGAPVTCSTAVLSVTVYPALIATNDVIQTSSTLTVNGSLLTNDLGIVSGAVYSVTGSPVAAANGTMLINPATGQYTFIPNPAFSGSVSATYTVCNLSVNPIICSTATIVLFVGDMPIAVNDATVTIINTPVSGNVAVNDVNLTNAVFTFGAPGTGTLSGNPSTGQFTFTPAAGFTGTTSATYTLCNVVSPPCATATIVFTIYPVLVAVNDQTITNLNTPVSGSLTANDLGLVSGGNYSVSVAPAPAGTGTVQVNPVTGQYTFTPATGYTGTVVINYTVCQINPSQCSSASLTIVVGAKSAIGLAKALSKTEYNNDGTLTQTYKVVVKNLGNQPLSDIAISDNLVATYPSPSTFTVQSIVNDASASSQLSVNAAFTGVNSNSVLTVPAASSLTVGRTDTIVFTVKVNPNGYTGTYNNSASVTAVGSGTLVSDGSANGLDPDPDNDGDAGNNNGPTSFTFSIVKIGIAKTVSVENIGNGCHNITFKFTIKNLGNSTIYNVAAFYNLDNTFGASTGYSIISGPNSVNKLLIPNVNYTGNGNNINMVTSSSSLAVGAVDTLLLKVKYCVKGKVSFSGNAEASGNSLPSGGFVGTDVSNDGLDPDPDKDGNAGGTGESVPTVFVLESDLFIPQGFSPNNDGVNDVLKIRGIENYPNNEFSIINRWGNVVYKKNGYDNTWNGTANTGVNYGSDLLPEGTYFYILDLGDGSKALKGYIYLNRSSR